jgi:hypothetical protein
MRSWCLVFMLACGGSTKSSSPPISNQAPPPTTPPAMMADDDRIPCDDGTGKCAIEVMGHFEKRMCNCKDKACADTVNTALTTWGTEMAQKGSSLDEKPDPELARRAADSMTRYTECMTKLMMPAEPTDPCGGDPCGGL